jgi:DNA-binding NarL/FixJ family response regulator
MFDDKTSAIRMFKAGALGFLTKSTSSVEIINAITEVLKGNRFISSEYPSDFLSEYSHILKSEAESFGYNFTKRELEVLKLICQGYTNKEAAKFLNVSAKSIEALKSRLFDKTGATNSAGLVTFAFEYGIFNGL